jgi:ATP-dependent helicase/nuclease subunit B
MRRCLQAVLQEDPACARRLQTLRTPVSDPDCTVSPETARLVFPRHLSLTQSKLDRYVLCHFHYYCSYVLKLQQEQIAQFRTQDIGTLIHAIMEAFFRRVTAKDPTTNAFADDLTEGECEVIVDDILQAYLHEISPDGQPPTNRLLHLFARLRNLALLLIDNLREEFRHSTFVPAFFELNIRERGSRDDAPATLDIRLGNGETASMGGIIDRVDVYRKDGNVYLRVVDYKTGSKEFSLDDVRQGLNVQLLLYLFTLLKNSPDTFKELMGMQQGGSLLPAGVMYLTANIPPITIDEDLSPEEIRDLAKGRLLRRGLLLNDPEILSAMNDQLDPAFLGEVKRTRAKSADDIGVSGKNLIDLDAFNALGEELEQTIRSIATSMKKGDAQARPLVHKNQEACRYCDMRAVCRSAVGEKSTR